jgi:hypothetical protein
MECQVCCIEMKCSTSFLKNILTLDSLKDYEIDKFLVRLNSLDSFISLLFGENLVVDLESEYFLKLVAKMPVIYLIVYH